MNEQDFATNGMILLALFAAFIVTFGVSELLTRIGWWLTGRGFNGDLK